MPNRPHPLPQIAFAILALVALACGAAPGGATPTASFTTATPGGRLSVSLIETQGAGAGAPGLAGTPIAGIAEITPTSPIAPEAARCPAPGQAALPQAAPAFVQLPETLLTYLSGGGPATILEATLRGWGAITEFGGLVRADRDFTGDGVPEVFVVALDPANAARSPQPGDVLIFGCDDGDYRLLYRAGTAQEVGSPLIVSADDLTGDGINDMVYASSACPAGNCLTTVSIIGWSPRLESFEPLVAETISQPYAGVRIEDSDGDTMPEVIVTVGSAAPLEAGPQRLRTLTYGFNGTLFALAGEQTAPAQFRIHVLHEADDLLVSRAYNDAVARYNTAINDTTLKSWQYPSEASYLSAYARFRLVVAYTLSDSWGQAQSTHDQLIADFTFPPTPVPEGQPLIPAPPGFLPFDDGRPGVAYARMANLFWTEVNASRDVRRACASVIAYASSNPAALDPLNSFGTSNRTYSPRDLCPF